MTEIAPIDIPLRIGFTAGVVRHRPWPACYGIFHEFPWRYRKHLRHLPALLRPLFGICRDLETPDPCGRCWKRYVRAVDISYCEMPAIKALVSGEIEWQELENFAIQVTEDPQNGHF